jgi:hypothetical protein
MSVELIQTANGRDMVDLDVHLRESWNPSGYSRSVTTDRCPDDAYVSADSWENCVSGNELRAADRLSKSGGAFSARSAVARGSGALPELPISPQYNPVNSESTNNSTTSAAVKLTRYRIFLTSNSTLQ